jgi:hypothetical protein
MTAPIASGGSDFAGWDLHPLESTAFHGAPPMQTFLDALPLAKEKLMAA